MKRFIRITLFLWLIVGCLSALAQYKLRIRGTTFYPQGGCTNNPSITDIEVTVSGVTKTFYGKWTVGSTYIFEHTYATKPDPASLSIKGDVGCGTSSCTSYDLASTVDKSFSNADSDLCSEVTGRVIFNSCGGRMEFFLMYELSVTPGITEYPASSVFCSTSSSGFTLKSAIALDWAYSAGSSNGPWGSYKSRTSSLVVNPQDFNTSALVGRAIYFKSSIGNCTPAILSTASYTFAPATPAIQYTDVCATGQQFTVTGLGTNRASYEGERIRFDFGNGSVSVDAADILDANGATIDVSTFYSSTTPFTIKVQSLDLPQCGTQTVSPIEIDPKVNLTLTSSTLIKCYDSLSTVTLNGTGGKTGGTLWYSKDDVTYQTSNKFKVRAGTTRFYVKDTGSKVCKATVDVPIAAAPSKITYTASITSAINCDGYTGTITCTTASGGTGSKRYSIDGGTSSLVTKTFSGLAEGNHTVRVTDGNSCLRDTTIYMAAPDPVTNSSQPSYCHAATTGEITITAGGGTPPYTYSKNANILYQTSNRFTGVSAPGTYNTRVKDSKGCLSAYAPTTLVTPLSASATNILHPCVVPANNPGSITITGSNGSPGSPVDYTYRINATGFTTKNSGTATTGVSSGTYSATLTDSRGCTTTVTNIVVKPPVSATTAVTKLTCDDATPDGKIVINATNGNTPYSYSISNPASYVLTRTFNRLDNTSYSVNVKDSRGCISQSINGALPTVGNVSVGVRDTLSATVNVVAQPLCYGDQFTLNLTTGSEWSGPFTYQWRKLNTASILDTGEDFTAIGTQSSSYYVTVTDTNNCSIIPAPDLVTVPTRIASSYSVPRHANYEISCGAGSDGVIDLQPVPLTGTGNFRYKWFRDNVAMTPGFTGPQDLSGLNEASYHVIIKDDNQCEVTFDPVIMDAPPTLTVSADTVIHQTCFNGPANGSMTLEAAGGVGGYSYALNALTNNSYDRLTYQPPLFNSLGKDQYTLMVKDGNGCLASTSYVVLGSPDELQITNVQKHLPLCYGDANGKFVVTGSGGVPGYQISLVDDDDQYIDSMTIGNLSAGNYTVYIRDSKGCKANSDTHTLNHPPKLLFSSLTTTPQSCSEVVDGTISASLTGGTGILKYSISSPVYQMNNVFTGLSTGGYTVTVKDGNSCSVSANTSVSMALPVLATISLTDTIKCYNDSTARLLASGVNGAPPYAFLWTSGESTAAITGKAAGYFSVNVTDSKGCSGSKDFTIEQPPAVSLQLFPKNYDGYGVSCHGAMDGEILTTTLGGVAPYSYSWKKDDGPIPYTLKDLLNAGAGEYSILVRDKNNCTIQDSAALTSPLAVVPSVFSKNNITCYGDNNGVLTLSEATGGFGSYQYRLDGLLNDRALQANTVFTALPPDTYTIVAIDDHGCSGSMTELITSPSQLSISQIIKANPLCFGNSNGTLTITASGGTAPFRVVANGGTEYPGQVIPGLAAGDYIVKVKDDHNCETTSGVQTLINPAELKFNSVTTDPQSCHEVIDGKITVSATGGTGALHYTINTSSYQSSPIFTGLVAGSYTVNLKDDNNCQKSATAPVGLAAPVKAAITQKKFIECFNQSTAELEATVQFGTAPYNFSWSSGETTAVISGKNAGGYNVTITDSKGCHGSKNFTIDQPSEVTVSTVAKDYHGFGVSCKTSVDGQISTTVLGGTPPYTYSWSNSSGALAYTTKDISSLAAEIYTVVVNDSKNCTKSSITPVIAPSLVLLSHSTKTDVTCHGGSDGTVVLSSSGGAGGYQYATQAGAWQAGSSFSAMTAATYTFRTRDINNCEASLPVTISQSPIIAIGFINIQPTICGQSVGSAEASVTGGTGGYSYEWKNAANNVLSTSSILSTAPNGAYSVKVTDAASCSQISSTFIDATGGPDFNVINILPARCFNSPDGQAALQIVNAHSPIAIQWSSNETGTTAFSLLPGANSAVITDNNNCQTKKTFNVPAPDPIATTNILTQLTCPSENTAAIDVNVVGGTGTYNYTWNGVAGSDVLQNVSAGVYDLRIIDSNNCIYDESFLIDSLDDIVISVLDTVTPHCALSTDGEIHVVAKGGNEGFSYEWDNGSTDARLINIGGGNHAVMATDAKGCEKQMVINVVAPDLLEVVPLSLQNPTCYGDEDGTLVLEGVGGVGAHVFSLDGNTWQSSAVFTDLKADTLIAQVKDDHGCIGEHTVEILQPDRLNTSINFLAHTTCGLSNGRVATVATGGNGAYTYHWTNGANQVVGNSPTLANVTAGIYNILVKDQRDCEDSDVVIINASSSPSIAVDSVMPTNCFNTSDGSAVINVSSGEGPYTIQWSNGETGAFPVSLPSGPNTVTVTDVNNCIAAKLISVGRPLSITLSSEKIFKPVCPGQANGSIQVEAIGGIGTFTYLWDGAINGSILDSISAGTYALQVRDQKGCSFDKQISVSDVPQLAITDTLVLPSCFGSSDGYIKASAIGGNGSFSYQWDNGKTGSLITALQAGLYHVTATDARGCVVSRSITLADPLNVTVGVSSSIAPKCFGSGDGALTLVADGGAGEYSYSLNGTSWQSSPSFSSLAANSYTIYAKDKQACVGTSAETLLGPDEVTVDVSDLVHTSCGQSNGAATAIGGGGNSFYDYVWTNSINLTVASTAVLNNAAADTYEVVVKDGNGCTVVEQVTINSSSSPKVAVNNLVTPSCVGDSNGQASATISDGQEPYTVLWNTGEITLTAVKLASGQGNVTITDANRCVTEKAFKMGKPKEIRLTSETTTIPRCPETETGAIQIEAVGGTDIFSYKWNDKVGTQDLFDIPAGEYELEVKDSKGCLLVKTFTLNDVPDLTFESTVEHPLCNGESTGSLDVTAKGGNGSFVYKWSTNASTKTISQLRAGNYSVTATDKNGCQVTTSFTLVNPPIVTFDLGPDFVTCPDQEFTIDSPIEANTYEWTKPDGLKSSEKAMISTLPGSYILEVITANGCFAADDIDVTNSESLLEADLLITSEAHVGDTIYVVDISWPQPDVINWNFTGDPEIIEEHDGYTLITYQTPGEYSVVLDANLSGCKSSFTQNFVILEGISSSGREIPDKQHNIISFSIHPNPFKQWMEVNVVLENSATVTLQLIQIGSNQLMFEDTWTDSKHYTTEYQVDELATGYYVLVIRSEDEVRSVRLLKL